jgi:hypothetical protein
MPLFWKSPFNKVVRSTEALTLGLAVGLVVGSIIGSILIPTVITNDVYKTPITLCGKVSNVLRVKIQIHGILSEVECKDGRVFDNFN